MIEANAPPHRSLQSGGQRNPNLRGNMRYTFIPWRKGSMVDLGGYFVGSERHAIQQAYTLRMVYGYDRVSVESESGTIVAVV